MKTWPLLAATLLILTSMLEPQGSPAWAQNPADIATLLNSLPGSLLDTTFVGALQDTISSNAEASIAVGPNHICYMTLGAFSIRPRTNLAAAPTVLYPKDVFVPSEAGTVNDGLTDMSIHFDPVGGRFIALAGGPFPEHTATNVFVRRWHLAVSKTSDPTQGWWRYHFADLTQANTTDAFDYPLLGFSADKVAIVLKFGLTSAIWLVNRDSLYGGMSRMPEDFYGGQYGLHLDGSRWYAPFRNLDSDSALYFCSYENRGFRLSCGWIS